MTSAVAAPIGQSSTLRPGLSDFGLTPSQIAAASQAQATVTPPLKPGLSDFGRTNPLLGVPTGSVDTSPTQQTVAISQPSDFDWSDAGVGAAAMLGIVLLIGGLGAAFVLRSHRREFRSA